MGLNLHKLGTKLHWAVLGTAMAALLVLVLASEPLLRGLVREDRRKLFVETFTRSLAEQVSHALEAYHQRVREVATELTLSPQGEGAEVRLLNRRAQEPMAQPQELQSGIFDLLLVVESDGTILRTNTEARFGRVIPSKKLWRRNIRDFREEQEVFLGAPFGKGKQDWYRSKMVAELGLPRPGDDTSRHYAIAFAEPIPKSRRVLVAVVNWEAIQKLLDSAEKPLAQVGFPSGYAFMFARDANTIIGHKLRDPAGTNNYGKRLREDIGLPKLSNAIRKGYASYAYEYPVGTGKVSGLHPVDDVEFGWTVGVGVNDADVIAPAKALAERLAIAGGLLVILALLVSRYLSRRVTSDLAELTHSAQRISDGFFGERAHVRSRDEVGQLANAFNSMAEKLAERDEVIRKQQERLFERRRLEQELNIASEVQRRLFPQFLPPLGTLDYAGHCEPARGVSGDYYDFVAVAPGKLGLLLADVSGKGLSAALLMASLHACVRTHAPLLGSRCGELVSTLNGLLYEATSPERFATVFYAIYEDATRQLTYVNSGHLPPLVLRGDGMGAVAAAGHGAAGVRARAEGAPMVCERLETGTPPLGIFQTIPTAEGSVKLEPGDWLLIFSDGISETANEQDVEFGVERLMEVVERNRHRRAEEMRHAILSEVRAHNGGRPAADDLTLIVARVN
jgi:serine phosphatase RsbU (regulator of sigma subunit)